MGRKKIVSLQGVLAVFLLALFCLNASAQVLTDEDLRDDPNLPREERIRRHKLRLQKLLEEYRARAAKQRKEHEAQVHQALTSQYRAGTASGRAAPSAAQPSGRYTVTAKNLPAKFTVKGRTLAKSSMAPAPAPSAQAVAFRVSRAIVYLSPFEVLAQEGDLFDTEVRIFDSSLLPFDNIVLHLKYDPLVVAPVAVNDAPIYDLLAGAPTLRVNTSMGRIYYAASLREALRPSTMTLLTIRWRARNPVLYSEIGFLSGKGGTRIGKGDGDILGYEAAGERVGGTLPANLLIVPRGDSPRKLMPSLSEAAMIGVDERVGLRIEADPETVKAGDEWVVSLVLQNEPALQFNDLNVRVLFDPDKLEVVDWHRGNWIREGVNIYDGFAHEQYPFDVFIANRADNERGEIVYHMGTTAACIFPSGEFARIKFKAKADASINDVWFDFQDPARSGGKVVTDVDFFGASVLFGPPKRGGRDTERPAPEPLRPPKT